MRSKPIYRCLIILSLIGFGFIVPLDRKSPFGIRTLIKALKNNQSIMLFPEGKISPTGEPSAHQPGLVWLVNKTNLLMIEIQITGAERSRFFAKSGKALWPRIEVQF